MALAPSKSAAEAASSILVMRSFAASDTCDFDGKVHLQSMIAACVFECESRSKGLYPNSMMYSRMPMPPHVDRLRVPRLLAAVAADEDGRDGKGAGAVQYGDLPWVAHNLWWQYRYTLDPETLDVCVSVLKRAVGYYMRLMTTNGTTLHLPLAESPEYASAVDTNYDLSLFRWGVGVLLHVADTLQPALKAEPAYARWKSSVLGPPAISSRCGVGAQQNAHDGHLLAAAAPMSPSGGATGQDELSQL